MSDTPILQIAVPTPLQGTFDYLPPTNQFTNSLNPGMRVLVRFGHRRLVGLIMGQSHTSRVEPARLKQVIDVLDTSPILDGEMLELLQWSSAYYHHPIGEVIHTALPKRLRQGNTATIEGTPIWEITEKGQTVAIESLQRAPRQTTLLSLLRQYPAGLDLAQLNGLQKNWRQAMRALSRKGLAKQRLRPCLSHNKTTLKSPEKLNQHQSRVLHTILDHLDSFTPFLLDGVTGSGKTEVYLRLVEEAVALGRQSLVLVPEIGLTPQLLGRFRSRFDVPLAVMHSGMSAVERHCAWDMARKGSVSVIIGTRSAVFIPLVKPGAIIVDEEHDSSFKQQDGFRYHARDIAVFRAKQYGIPVVLGSATPSLESFNNVKKQKYQLLNLPERAGKAKPPHLEVIDLRCLPIEEGLSKPLLQEIRLHLASEGQVLLFLNRRGFAPVLICHQCGWAAICDRCDTHMTLHAANRRLCCHHCGADRRPPHHCPNCRSADLRLVGEGTERVEQALKRHFTDIPIIRIDRDTTRRKGEMQSKLEQIHRGEHRILIGTQMLSKGHDFPGVTLVGIVNFDQGLYSTDFRAMERMAQLIVQVAGRAGRAGKPGKVLLQTHQPTHPLLETLISSGYGIFCAVALQERLLAGLPPHRHMALLRAEATDHLAPLEFLDAAHTAAPIEYDTELEIWGPAPAPMERRAGRYRAQLLVITKHRRLLMGLLDDWIPLLGSIPGAHKVRWSLDVDPIDLY